MRRKKRQTGKQELPQPKPPQKHPLWDDFKRFLQDGIYHEFIPLRKGFTPRRINEKKWMPYWWTFLKGVHYGIEQAVWEFDNELRDKLLEGMHE